MKRASEECANQLKLTGQKAILIIDEIHRFNKLQQDSLLPWVEHGSFILIGATTENPSFKLNAALLSRCRVFQLKKLSQQAIVGIIQRAARIKLELYNKSLVVKNDSELKTESQLESKSESNSKLESKSESKVKLESKSESELKLELKSGSKSKSESEIMAETNITDFNNTTDDNNKIYIDKEVLNLLVVMSDGDARNALNVNYNIKITTFFFKMIINKI